MSTSSIATSFADLKAANNDRPTAVGQVIGSSATNRKPKRPGRRRLLILCALGALILAGATFWFIDNAGYESTDDATIEAHVIQVSPKISAHSKLTEAEAQQNVAQAGSGQAKADLTSAQATADNAEADLKRNEKLYQTHVIDRREYDASVAQAKSTTANVESATKKVASQEAQVRLTSAQYVTAEAEEKQREAQLRQAQLQLSYTKIFAPFDGRVTKKSVEPGNYVQPGQTLFSLVPPNVWVVADFKETQLKKMKVGQPVSVRIDAIPGRDFNAHVESFQVGTGSRFTLLPPENATGNFVKVVQRVPVKIVFDEPSANLGRLWAGESVEPRVNVRDNSAERGQRAEPLPPAIVGAPDYSAAIAEQ